MKVYRRSSTMIVFGCKSVDLNDQLTKKFVKYTAAIEFAAEIDNLIKSI